MKYLKKNHVEFGSANVFTLCEILNTYIPFKRVGAGTYQFLYPYEEPPKQRMTHKMLAEWCIKRNGQFKYEGIRNALIYSTHEYDEIHNDYEYRKIKTWFEDYIQLFPKSYQKETCRIVCKEVCEKILEELPKYLSESLYCEVVGNLRLVFKDLGVKL